MAKIKKTRGTRDRVYAITLPTQDNFGNDISTKELRKTIIEICDKFGGATIYPETGGCWADKGKLYCDKNIIVEAAIDKEMIAQDRKTRTGVWQKECKKTDDIDKCAQRVYKKRKDWLQKKAERWGKRYGQWAIMETFEVVNDVVFVNVGAGNKPIRKNIRGKQSLEELLGR